MGPNGVRNMEVPLYTQISTGLPDPALSSLPRLTYVMRGVRRLAPSSRDHQLPITPEILRSIASTWSCYPASFHTTMLWAAFYLGFFGFMRAGEFTCPSLRQFDLSSMLSPGDVFVDSRTDSHSLTVVLKRSKCDPFGVGFWIHLGRTHQALCPVAAVLAYLAIRPATPGPLFIFRDGSPPQGRG
jgi:hypothetical protein